MPRIILGLLLLLLIAGCGSDEAPPTPAAAIITPTAVVANVPTVTAGPTRVVLTWLTATTTATVPSPASATVTAPTATPLPPTLPPTVTPPPGETAPVACSWPAGWVAHRVAEGETVGRLAACVGAIVADIVAANCLPQGGYLIFAGQTLGLPRACAATLAAGALTPPPSSTSELMNPNSVSPAPVFPTAPSPNGPTILVTPNMAPAGTTVQLDFQGFFGRDTVQLQMVRLGQTTACDTVYIASDADGRARFTVPAHAPRGLYQLIAASLVTVNGVTKQSRGSLTVSESNATSGCGLLPTTATPEPTQEATPAAEGTPVGEATATAEPTPTPAAAPTEEPTPTGTTIPTAEPTAVVQPTATP